MFPGLDSIYCFFFAFKGGFCATAPATMVVSLICLLLYATFDNSTHQNGTQLMSSHVQSIGNKRASTKRVI